MRSRRGKPKLDRRKQVRRSRDPRAISLLTEDAEANFPVSEWMIPATDAHGHSAKVFTRCPPSYKHQISSILQKRLYPWETESDLVRVAVHRLLNDIDKNIKDPDISSQQAILNALAEVCSQQMAYAHFKETLEKTETTVKELIAADAKPMARKIVKAVADQLEKFEEKFWKERYEKVIVERYGELLK